MMLPSRIGRYHGGPKIGWSAKELVWLEAALTMSAMDFFYACDDIASMSGRTVAAITQKAKEIKRDREIQRLVKVKKTSS